MSHSSSRKNSDNGTGRKQSTSSNFNPDSRKNSSVNNGFKSSSRKNSTINTGSPVDKEEKKMKTQEEMLAELDGIEGPTVNEEDAQLTNVTIEAIRSN